MARPHPVITSAELLGAMTSDPLREWTSSELAKKLGRSQSAVRGALVRAGKVGLVVNHGKGPGSRWVVAGDHAPVITVNGNKPPPEPTEEMELLWDGALLFRTGNKFYIAKEIKFR